MKRIALLSMLAVAVVLAPGSTAATHQVSMTAAGFAPKALTVLLGDTVTWTNADTRNRRVVSTQAGFTSPVLAPGQTYSFTFTKLGKFNYEDATVQPKQRGTITVRAPAPVATTIGAQPRTVTFGRSTVISGQLTSGRSGEKVTINAKTCNGNFSKVGDTTSTTGGAWSFQTKPLANTAYRVVTSEVSVLARPRLTLAKVAAHKYRARVYANQSFAGKNVTFQRWNATRHVWVGVRSVTLVDTGTGIAPTVISGKDFRSRIAAGKRVRIAIGKTAAGTCYLASSSGTIRS